MSKSLLIILLLIFCVLDCYSQDVQYKYVYSFEQFQVLDTESKEIVETVPEKGLVIFSTFTGVDFISVISGENVIYNFPISNSKTESVSSNIKMHVYLGIQEFQGHKIPIQLFEIYNLFHSKSIPETFLLEILHSKTTKVVSAQAFINIARVIEMSDN